ncbi:autotransporter outer membrane beta-barrel domain-containing protein [Martelella alba]|nr:autotransporter outer membrane beta-barrel domain-containing protein [Martelella alba]
MDPTAANAASRDAAFAAYNAAVGADATTVYSAPTTSITSPETISGEDVRYVDDGASLGISGPSVTTPTAMQEVTAGNALYYGSAGASLDDAGSTSAVVFDNTTAGAMGSFIRVDGGTAAVIDASFDSGGSVSSYAAIDNYSGSVLVADSMFTNNNGGSLGGAIHSADGASLAITNSQFTGNASTYSAGAVYNAGATAAIVDSVFTGNTASQYGGAIRNGYSDYLITDSSQYSDLTITDSRFIENTAGTAGGAIAAPAGVLTLNTSSGGLSLFSGNTAAGEANSIAFATSAADLTSTLNVNVLDGGLLDMRDPIAVYSNTGTIAVSKGGDGVWALGGENDFTRIDDGKTTFDLNEGTLYLYRDGEVANATAADPDATVAAGSLNLDGAGSTFTLGSSATLVAAGDNMITTDGTITLNDGATIRGGTAADANGNANRAAPLTTLGGATSLTLSSALGAVRLNGTLNLSAPASADTFTLDATLADGGANGSVNVEGEGRTVLTGNNVFTGATTITDHATLALSGGGSIEKSSGVDVGSNAAFDIAATDAGASITTLTGSGETVLGSQTLTQTAASGTYSGVISGEGGMTVASGGTYTLLGDNRYTGDTKILSGTLQLGNGGASGAIAGNAAIGDGAILAINRSDEWAFGHAITGIGALVQQGSGRTILTGDSAAFAGTTTVANGVLEVDGALGGSLAVQDGAMLTGIGTVGTSMISSGGIMSPGTATGGGILMVNGNLSNNGLIAMQNGSVGDSVVVTGNYSGGGAIAIDTNFASDTSDVLTVNGDITGGTTLIAVNNVTSGVATGNDVLVVAVGGTSSDGDFALANGPVGSGAYLYDILRKSDDFYLATDGTYQPAVPVYESYSQLLMALGRLPTLRQRVGRREIYDDKTGRSSEDGSQAQIDALWTRIDGTYDHFGPDTSATGYNTDFNHWAVNTGVDGLLYDGGNGQLIGGVYAKYANGFGETTSNYGDGKTGIDGYGVGATMTWYDENGFYADGQAQFLWYDSDLSSKTLGTLVDGNNGTGFSTSIEVGRSFPVDDSISITPQAQLSYSLASFDDFSGYYGEKVSMGNDDSLRLRLGLSTENKTIWQDEAGQARSAGVYAIANVHREFLDGTGVNVSGLTLTSDMQGWYGEVGFGGTYSWADGKYAAYGELSGLTGFSDTRGNYSVAGKAGLMVRW